MKKTITVSIFLLFIFYSYLFWTIANPKVSKEYADYYIYKTINISPSEWKKIKPLKLGITYSHSDIVFNGWSYDEKNHRWTEGKLAEIIFIIEYPLVLSNIVTVSMQVFPCGDTQNVTFAINDRVIQSQIINKEINLSLSIKKEFLNKGINVLKINLPNAFHPKGDGRELGLGLKTILIAE